MPRRLARWLLGLLAVGPCALASLAAAELPAARSIWIEPARLAALPTSGPAWESLLAAAQQPTGAPNLANKNDPTNVRVLAKALVYARTGEEHYRSEVWSACRAAIGTEVGGSTLALGRELAAYVLAADLADESDGGMKFFDGRGDSHDFLNDLSADERRDQPGARSREIDPVFFRIEPMVALQTV